MARLPILGHFEWGANYFWDVVGPGAVSATAHTGSYSWNVFNTGSSNKNLSAAIDDGYGAFWFRTNGISSRRIWSWFGGSPLTELGFLYLDGGTGRLQLWTGTILAGTLRATGTTSIQLNTWYQLQVRFHANGSTGDIAMRIDGTDDGSWTGNTGIVSWDQFRVYGDAAIDSLYDDLVVNDATGGADNSWPDDVRLSVIRPNAAGSHDDLTGVGAANNWDTLDEVPPDGDTSYVYSSTIDQYGLYNMTACGLSAVTILGVTPEAIAKETVADGGELAMMLKSGATTVTDSDVALLTSYWLVQGARRTVDPDTSAAWTTTALDALEVGVKIR